MFTMYPREDRRFMGAAFGNASLRGIAKLVNDESQGIREYIAAKHDIRINSKDKRARDRAELRLADIAEGLEYYQRLGAPVKVDHKLIARYLNGSAIRDSDQVRAIIRTAAKRVAPQIGIDPGRVGYSRELIKPDSVLVQWRDSQRHGLFGI
jgi:hypothetical protein